MIGMIGIMPRFKDQAICIRLIDWSETSQIVTLFTEQHGKLRGLAKGSKRTSPSSVARFSGGIELLTGGQAVGVIKPTADLASLTEWDLQHPYWHLRQNLTTQELAFYAADLTNAMLSDHDPHPTSFAALADLLINLTNPLNHGEVLLRYQWQLLEDTGYRPQLEIDVQTGHPIDYRLVEGVGENAKDPSPSYAFDPISGGITCGLSVNPSHERWRVRPSTVMALRQMSTGLATTQDRTVIDRANKLLCAYVRTILDRELPTMRFLLSADHDGD